MFQRRINSIPSLASTFSLHLLFPLTRADTSRDLRDKCGSRPPEADTQKFPPSSVCCPPPAKSFCRQNCHTNSRSLFPTAAFSSPPSVTLHFFLPKDCFQQWIPLFGNSKGIVGKVHRHSACFQRPNHSRSRRDVPTKWTTTTTVPSFLPSLLPPTGSGSLPLSTRPLPPLRSISFRGECERGEGIREQWNTSVYPMRTNRQHHPSLELASFTDG